MPRQSVIGILLTLSTLTSLIVLKSSASVYAFAIACLLYGFQCFIEKQLSNDADRFEKRFKEIESRLNSISIAQGFKK